MREYFEKVYSGTEQSFHDVVRENIKNEKKMFIVTANPETLMIAEENEDFKKCLLDDNTIIVPDGIGVIKGMKMLKFQTNGTITGVELAKKVLEFANDEKKSIYLFGAKKEVIDGMRNLLGNSYPNIEILGMQDGYVGDKQKVFEDIIDKKPDIVLVALGIPHQELLIYNNLDRFEKGIFIGVGGTFDVLSGMKKRAPKIFIKTHTEWLYRITTEPKRLKRFFKSNVRYIMKVKRERKTQ